MVSLCSRSTPEELLGYLKERRVEVIVTADDRVDLRAALEELRDRHGVKTVRVDSGSGCPHGEEKHVLDGAVMFLPRFARKGGGS